MKSKKLLLTLWASIIMGLAAGCVPAADEPDEATLTLSQTSVQLNNAAQTAPTIVVTTNQSRVTAFANAEWISATVQGTTVTIAVEANTLGRDRKGQVLVSAGTLSETIDVVQSAADMSIEVEPTNQVMTNKGGDFLIDVKSNSGVWTVEPGEEYSWLRVRSFHTGIVQVSVDENNEPEPREAKLYARAGNLVKEITVAQAGKGVAKFQMPLLNRTATTYELMTYEAKTYGNLFFSYQPGQLIPQLGINTPAGYVFACNSPVISVVTYFFDSQKDVLTQVMYRLPGAQEELKSDELKELLRSNGFVLNEPEDNGNYTGKLVAEDIVWHVTVEPANATMPVYAFVAKPKQDRAYPTFEGFPYDKHQHLGNPDFLYEDIKAEEEAEGNVVSEENELAAFPGYYGKLSCEIKGGDGKLDARYYEFDPGDADENKLPSKQALALQLIYSDINLAFWFDQSSGNYLMTDEFTELMRGSGYKFFASAEGIDFYINESMMLFSLFQVTKISEDGEPVLLIAHVSPQALGGNGGLGAIAAQFKHYSKGITSVGGL